MSSLNKSSFYVIALTYLPVLLLFFSVFNKFNFNYLKIEYFSFNFAYILIFYWTLKNPNLLGYISIFFAGIINVKSFILIVSKNLNLKRQNQMNKSKLSLFYLYYF